jgi:hypothetical protein
MRRLPLIALAVLFAAGCGGRSAVKLPAAASVIPAKAPLVVSIDTGASGQLAAATDLLGRFPETKDAVKVLSYRGLGPELDVVLFDLANNGNDGVGLVRPANPAKLEGLLAQSSGQRAHEVVDGWTVYADSRALIEKFKGLRTGASLSTNADFRDAVASLPAGALARFFVDGPALTASLQRDPSLSGFAPALGLDTLRWLAGSLQARHDGITFQAEAKGVQAKPSPDYAHLASRVPADAVVYASFTNLTPLLERLKALPAVQKQLGGLAGVIAGPILDKVFGLFGKEGALYVEPGKPDPSVTLVLQESDPVKAFSTVDALARLGGAESVQIAGRAARKVEVDHQSIYYVTVSAGLVLSTTAAGIRSALETGGSNLTRDSFFPEAKQEAGMPSQTGGFLYVSLANGIPALGGLADQFGGNAASVKPLKALLVYLTGGPRGTLTAKGFLAIK